MNHLEIIECLVSERQKRKLSQSYIAERLGSTRITINAYEKGRRSVPIEFLVSWATLLKQEIKIQDIQTDHYLQLKDGAIS